MKGLLVGYDGSGCSDAMLAGLSEAGLPAELDVRVLCVADVWLPPGKLEPAFPDPAPLAVRKAWARALAELELGS